MVRTCNAYGEEERRVHSFGVGNLRERDHLGDPGVDGWKILRWSFGKWYVGVRTGSSWLRTGTEARTCECGNEPSGSIKCREFLD
jgi:hypothetical protein